MISIGPHKKVFLAALTLASSLAHLTAQTTAPAKESPPPVATLTTFRPTAADVLTVPEGVAGDFDVAKQPPVIDFGILPGQWEGAKLWSNWGDSIYASDGRFYCSIGDHDGPHGHSYVYQVDPAEKTMRLVVDYTKVVGVPPGQYAPGKIHCALMEAGDGWLYFLGYQGSGGTTKEFGYQGDWMLRYHLASGKAENLGAAVPDNGAPCSILHAPSKTVYGLTSPGQTIPPPRRSQFFAYDLEKKKLLFLGGPRPNMARTLLLAKDGRVYYSYSPEPPEEAQTQQNKTKKAKRRKAEPVEGVFVRYDPKTNTVAPTAVRVPGDGILRAASRPDAKGVAYAISKDGVVFAFDTNTEKVTPITSAFVAGPPYTTSMRLDPTDRYLYYIPSAHGGSREHGTAVIQLDVKTGRRKVLAFLNDYIRKQSSYNLGGTFGIALSKDGDTLFVCFNGGLLSQKKNDFGLCSAMVLHIPQGER